MISKLLHRFVDWYIKKYWSEEYILKNELEKEFLAIRKDEERIQTEFWANEMEDFEINLKRKTYIEVTKLENDVNRMNEVVEEYKTRIKKAENLHFKSIIGAQGNVQVVTQIQIKLNEARDAFSKLAASMEKVGDNAYEKLKEIDNAKPK